MKLYSYWRSSTAYRVRIALNLKEVAFDTVGVDLVAGAQRSASYAALNPGQSVPTLVREDGTVLTQSIAILEWLEETYPKPALLPSDPSARAQVRAAALGIASDIHPVNNLRVLGALKHRGHSQEEVVVWMNEWMLKGLSAFAQVIAPDTPFCFGQAPGLADICLIPQLYNAHRWGCDLGALTRLTDIETRCLALPAFDAARPETQPHAA